MVDARVDLLIKNNVINCHRSLFVLLGEKGFRNVITLYDMLMKIKAKLRPSILWCCKDIEFPLGKIKDKHQKSTKKQSLKGEQEFDAESELDSFIASTNIKFCNYSDTNLICGQTFDMAILEDLKTLTPGALAHSVKTVEGGGMIIILAQTVKSVPKTMAMLKNSDFLKSRFHKRLFFTFETISCCAVLDDKMNVLFNSRNSPYQNPKKNKILQLTDLPQNSVKVDDEEKYGKLSEACHTSDQIKFLLQCLDTLKKNSSYLVVSASSPTGRGKSAVLGLAISGAIDMKYSNIFISSLSFNNVTVVFKYILKGLDALGYEESKHYDIIKYDHPIFNTSILSLNIFKDHPQAVRFIYPGEDLGQLDQAELLVVDEAAAIPLAMLKKCIGPYVVLMASSVEGFGACGKFFYEKMIKEIHHPSSSESKVSSVSLFPTSERSTLVKVELNEPLHFSPEDGVEKWINSLLCLESSQTKLSSVAPPLELCRLVYVCRNTLFSYEPHAEKFLQQLMSMFLCSKREISLEDLFTMADGKDYHIFCLLPPPDNSGKPSYEILCAILVHKVKQVPWNFVYCGVNQPDPIPKSFNDWRSPSEDKSDFLPIKGVQIVDIVTHPTHRHLGFDYDLQALWLMQEFYCGKSVPLDDKPYLCSIKSESERNNKEQDLPLLLQLTEVEPEEIEYILVSFYLTPELLRSWKKSGFIPVYITTEKNSAQEHLCMMMKGFGGEKISTYMETNWISFVDNYSTLLASSFKYFSAVFALGLLVSPFSKQVSGRALTKEDIDIILKPQCMKALGKYCHNLGDLHSVVPSINILSKIYFGKHFIMDVEMTAIQQAILLSFGLQHKTINDIAKDTDLPSTQVHAKLNQIIRRLTKYLEAIIEKEVEKTLPVKDVNMVPISQSLDEELEEAANKIKEKQAENLKKLKEMDLSEFAIKGSEEDWGKALHTGRKTLVSIKSLKKPAENVDLPQLKRKKEEKNKKRKR